MMPARLIAPSGSPGAPSASVLPSALKATLSLKWVFATLPVTVWLRAYPGPLYTKTLFLLNVPTTTVPPVPFTVTP